MAPAPIPGTAYLAAEEMAEHPAAPQVPDDDEAPAVADEDLVGVAGVFLQSFHHLKHPPVAGLLGQPGGGKRGEAMLSPPPAGRTHHVAQACTAWMGSVGRSRGHTAKGGAMQRTGQ